MSPPEPQDIGVSRETFQRLETYVALLEKWNPKINLVSKSTLSEVWGRHIADSLQLIENAPTEIHRWADLGSGGGFPGLVVALVLAETAPEAEVILVESDTRKCVFLRTVLRETGVSATVLSARIEETVALGADVVSARALSDLPSLLHHLARHGTAGGVGLFPKGKTWETEIAEAQKLWAFDCHAVTSKTELTAVLLQIRGLRRV